MSNLNLLTGHLEVIENPGIESLDPRFQDIVTTVETNDFAKVGTLVEALFQENIFDIRLIAYYLHAVLVEQGFKALGAIFDCATKLFQENWAAVGPTQKKEKHAQRSFNWFLTKLQDKLHYHQETNDDTWKKWLQETTGPDVQVILDACENFRKALLTVSEDAENQDRLMKLNQWLKDLQKIIAPPEPAPTAAAETEAPTSGSQAGDAGTSQPGMIEGMAVDSSYHFQVLVKKLEAFDILVQKGNFNKAAIVADDINTIIASFDPRLFFPKTFAKYYKQLSGSIDSIAPLWESKESIQWQMTSQFYKVDLDGFVND